MLFRSRVLAYCPDVLVIDDGSTDATPKLLPEFPVEIIRHSKNRGYGKSLRDAMRFAVAEHFDWLITMDCDEQHEPEQIPDFVRAIERGDADVISGSRYLKPDPMDDAAPEARQRVNGLITQELNQRLDYGLTDAFCGFKAYRTAATRNLRLTVDGYDFPLQFWVQAAANGLRVREIPVRRLYKDLHRTFGGGLDDPERRLRVYRDTLHRELHRCRHRLAQIGRAHV